MRLLHAKTLQFHEFFNLNGIPYAILSHTWGPEEVLFQNLDGLTIDTTPDTIKRKEGYKKIQACCAQANYDGFEYVWIDTCCIDKRSSAELSEAINSMYGWYQNSTVCYAYLSDVPNGLDAETTMSKFLKSRWFTRGWTLQELIAPLILEFYGDQWLSKGQKASLGTKRRLQTEISQITKIPVELFSGGKSLDRYSVAQKMSWAALRQTTRIEDTAYCLMGLFNVNIPLLYGEAERAFIRLQEEIMKISNDETIFAWESSYQRGLLAKSPSYFKESGKFVSTDEALIARTIPFTVTHMGIHMEVLLPKALDTTYQYTHDLKFSKDTAKVAILNCQHQDTKLLIGVFLVRQKDSGPERYVRMGHQDGSYTGLSFVNRDIFKPQVPDQDIHGSLNLNRKIIYVMSAAPWKESPWLPPTHWYCILHIKECPTSYSVKAAWPEGAKIKAVEDNSMMIGIKTPMYHPPCALLFEDKDDQSCFSVEIRLDSRNLLLQIKPGRSEPFLRTMSVYFDDLDFHLNATDHDSLTLPSGRILSATVRLQKIGHDIGYGIYVSMEDLNQQSPLASTQSYSHDLTSRLRDELPTTSEQTNK